MLKIDLRHGDCLQLLPTIPDDSVDAIICDLPYGSTANSWDSIIPLEPLWEQYNRIIRPDCAIVLTCSQPFTSMLVSSNPRRFKYEWIWEKTVSSGSLNAKKMPLKRHENILVFAGLTGKVRYFPQMAVGTPYQTKPETFNQSNYGHQQRPTLVNKGTRYPTSIIEVSNPRIKGGYPTQKPVELMRYLITTYTEEGDTVLDNSMGSGTTGVACVQTNRHFVGIDSNEDAFIRATTRIEKEQSDNQFLNW